MNLMYKQLMQALLQNRIFVFLLMILAVLASFMYFFVQFSIDGNMEALKTLSTLNPNEILYKNALNSNGILAQNFLIALVSLTGFVYAMFYGWFLKKNGKQIGCLKALGFKNATLAGCFMVFSAMLSLMSGILGLIAGYFGSGVLLRANMRSYGVSDLVKDISAIHVITGILSIMVVSATVSMVMYARFVWGKENASLIAGAEHRSKFSGFFRLADNIADKLVSILPIQDKFPLRIAFRKPMAAFMILLAAMGFTVMCIIGVSLNLSSGKVYQSQTEGHLYLYDTQYEQYVQQSKPSAEVQTYLSVPGVVSRGNDTINQTVVSLEKNKELFILVTNHGAKPEPLQENGVYISPALHEMYGMQKGDAITIEIQNHTYTAKVADIAMNAKLGCIYVDQNVLAEWLGLSEHAYNGILSMIPQEGGSTVITHEQKLEVLGRAAVSNQNSAIINQGVGILAGSFLIFLALLLNFQDSTKDILILHLMGYREKEIRKMLINVYRPILWLSFLLTLWPAIGIARSVQRTLSIQTGDYMPFGTNPLIIAAVFVLLNLIYFLMQAIFSMGIRRAIRKEEITEYTNI